MPNSVKPERLSPWQVGLMASLPLLGVFFTGLASGVFIDGRLIRLNIIEFFCLVTLPLAAYAAVYAFYVCSVRDNGRPFVKDMPAYLAIFMVTILIFPLMIFAIMHVVAVVSFSVIAVPFLAGFLYGIILSVIAGMPYRFISHALGGGVVGLLIFYVYLLIVWLANPALDDADLCWSIRSAMVLTLCYLPHFLATRPWAPGRHTPGQP